MEIDLSYVPRPDQVIVYHPATSPFEVEMGVRDFQAKEKEEVKKVV